ncbi:MAG: hypothetical protein ABIT96_00280 [Ferruginibacter sp.]
MRKTTAILFLLAFLICCNADRLAMMVNRLQMREKIAEAIHEKNSLEAFYYTKAEYASLHFTDDGHEILIGGRQYDIATVEMQDDMVIIKCLADHKEENIKKNAAGSQQQKSLIVEKSLDKLFTCSSGVISLTHNFIVLKSRLLPPAQNLPLAFALEIPKPPPALV